jgi:hypothetical protein
VDGCTGTGVGERETVETGRYQSMTENSNIALGNSFRKTVFFAALVEVGCFLV